MPNNYGGKRAGAGRKPIGTGRAIKVCITLTQDDIDELRALNPNISAAVRSLIRTRQDSAAKDPQG